MGLIDIFRNGSMTSHNTPYALYRLQLAHAVGQCILRHGDSDKLSPNDFGKAF